MASRGRPQDLRGVIDERFRQVWERIKELERPDWTQIRNAPSKVLHPATAFGGDAGFTATPTLTLWGANTITVPDGFTKALVDCSGHMTVQNTTGGRIDINVWAYIQGSYAGPATQTIQNNEFGSAGSEYARVVTGLSGGDTITGGLMVASTPSSANTVAVSTIYVLFIRE